MISGLKPRSPQWRGRLLMASSAWSFAVMGCLTRLLASVPSSQKVFFRSLIGLALVLLMVALRRRPLGRPKNIPGLVWRGVLGSAALLCYFYAIDHCGLAKATLYCYTYPIWTTLLAWLELGERPTCRRLLATVAALFGVALTFDVRSLAPMASTFDEAVGLLAGVLSGAAMVSVRRLRRSESSWWIVIFFSAIGALFSAPPTLAQFHRPSLSEWMLLTAIALTAASAQLLMTEAYRFLTAAEGSVLSLTVVVWSSVLSIVLLGEVLPTNFWVGAALVIGASWQILSDEHGSSPHSVSLRRRPIVE